MAEKLKFFFCTLDWTIDGGPYWLCGDWHRFRRRGRWRDTHHSKHHLPLCLPGGVWTQPALHSTYLCCRLWYFQEYISWSKFFSCLVFKWNCLWDAFLVRVTRNFIKLLYIYIYTHTHTHTHTHTCVSGVWGSIHFCWSSGTDLNLPGKYWCLDNWNESPMCN